MNICILDEYLFIVMRVTGVGASVTELKVGLTRLEHNSTTDIDIL